VANDVREKILARMLEVLKGVPGMAEAYRNKVEFPDTKRPVAILLDSDEIVGDNAQGKGRPVGAPLIITATPEVYVIDTEQAAELGTSLNQLRAKVIKAIMSDSQLLALSKDNDVRYEGMATGLSVGRSMEGEAALNFAVTYVLKLADL